MNVYVMFGRLFCRNRTGVKNYGWTKQLQTPLPRCFSQIIILFKPTLTRASHFTRDAPFSSASKILVSNLSICTENGAILTHRNPKILAHVRRNGSTSTTSLDINTNVSNNVFLFKYDRPTYFKYLNGFGVMQLIFWAGMSYVLCTLLTVRDPKQALKEYLYDNFITVLLATTALLVGIGSAVLIFAFTAKSVRYLVLHKGGKSVSFVTYHPLNNNVITVPIENVKCKSTRKEMRNFLAVKVQGRLFYYLLDSGGEFINATLFDHTVGISRL